jgi:PAS domain S-box-containing protein
MLSFLRRYFAGHRSRAEATTPAHQAALTGKHVAQHAAHLSEERFRLLVESVQEYAIFMLDTSGHVVTWNIGAERIKSYRASEIIGQHFSRFYPPEDVAAGKPARALDTATTSGKYEDEGWRVRKDGSRFWASVVITALRDTEGKLYGFGKVTRDMTERKKAEERARTLLEEEAARRAAEASVRVAEQAQREERRHREQLQITLSSIGDAVIVTDMSGCVTFVNPVAQALTGWSQQEAVGRPLEQVFRIVNEESRRPVENPVARVLREGIIVGLANHTVLIGRSGQSFPIDDSAAPIRDVDGSIAGVVLVFRDVTEARGAIEARLRLAAIVESSDDAIISKNLSGVIMSWNRGAEHLFGYTATEIIGQPLALLVPPEYPDELPHLLERLQAGERIEHFETVRVCKDGSRVDVSLTISPVRDSEGRIVGASKIARDITLRKRQDAALRFLAEASKLLSALLDLPSTLQKVATLSVPAFADACTIDLLNADGTLERVAVAHVNPGATTVLRNLTPDASNIRPVVRSGQAALLSHVPQADDTDPERARLVRELGVRSYIAVPLAIRGHTCGVVSFVTADSGRRFEQSDLQVAEDLAHRAGIAMENARLYSELKDADRRKDEFLAMLAHELRNPLAPIRNALHILRMPGADRQAVDQARQITERQVQHMVRLVDDLLDVSRILRGRIALRNQRAELATIVAGAVETAQPLLDAQGQQLSVSVPTQPLPVRADPTRLTQVIANLLHNAAKFSALGGRIWLTAEGQGSDVVVRVRDEGAGIRADLLPRIFDLFVQDDRSLERSRGGLGIGLTVARQLVELHGGSIAAHSAGPGQGSEFTVRLPRLNLDVARTPPNRQVLPPQRRDPKRILVVDDNVDAAESVGMIMRLAGHSVRLLYNGPDALAAAQADQPDVIILDIGLPGMSGYEVARHLRQQAPFQRTLLIAVTGYGQEEDRRRSREAGFDVHLTKPVDPQHLQSLVARDWSAPRDAASTEVAHGDPA